MDMSESEALLHVNAVCDPVIRMLKNAYPSVPIDEIAARMIYGGCFLMSVTIPETRRVLSPAANLAYQCLVQSAQTK